MLIKVSLFQELTVPFETRIIVHRTEPVNQTFQCVFNHSICEIADIFEPIEKVTLDLVMNGLYNNIMYPKLFDS